MEFSTKKNQKIPKTANSRPPRGVHESRKSTHVVKFADFSDFLLKISQKIAPNPSIYQI